jgi:hypothetical protein
VALAGPIRLESVAIRCRALASSHGRPASIRIRCARFEVDQQLPFAAARSGIAMMKIKFGHKSPAVTE